MIDTPVSLLERVKRRGKAEDWELLIQVYTPLIRRWLNRDQGLQSDAEDLTQETLSTVVQKLPDFVRQRQPARFAAGCGRSRSNLLNSIGGIALGASVK